MDSYHFYSAMKYEYVGITDERNALIVDLEVRLDHLLLSLSQLETALISFSNKRGGLFALLGASSPAEHGNKAAALH
jgi:hypothetical protein